MDEQQLHQIQNQGSVHGQIGISYGPVTMHFGSPTISVLPEHVWMVPRRNGFFTGREALLTALHDSFTGNRTAVLAQGQAINGLGGIGKTQIAMEYAHRYQSEYRFVLWANAATHETLISAFVSIADELKLPERALQEHNKIVVAVQRWLSTNEGWLLLVDNAHEMRNEMVNQKKWLQGNLESVDNLFDEEAHSRNDKLMKGNGCKWTNDHYPRDPLRGIGCLPYENLSSFVHSSFAS